MSDKKMIKNMYNITYRISFCVVYKFGGVHNKYLWLILLSQKQKILNKIRKENACKRGHTRKITKQTTA